MGTEQRSSDWMGKASVLFVEIGFQEPLYKEGLAQITRPQGGKGRSVWEQAAQCSAGFSPKVQFV